MEKVYVLVKNGAVVERDIVLNDYQHENWQRMIDNLGLSDLVSLEPQSHVGE